MLKNVLGIQNRHDRRNSPSDGESKALPRRRSDAILCVKEFLIAREVQVSCVNVIQDTDCISNPITPHPTEVKGSKTVVGAVTFTGVAKSSSCPQDNRRSVISPCQTDAYVIAALFNLELDVMLPLLAWEEDRIEQRCAWSLATEPDGCAIFRHVAHCIPTDDLWGQKRRTSLGHVVAYLRGSQNGGPEPAQNARSALVETFAQDFNHLKQLVEHGGADPEGYSEGDKASKSDDDDGKNDSPLAPREGNSKN
mmetsp:Transcript_21316/g.70662  ORF Transcript_21316/g.70662 Transcript_21316/m.70662 type:complete len:252 (+) Transcript_21316:1226-1981(+)